MLVWTRRTRSGERSPAGVAGACGPAKPLEPPGAARLLQTNPPERLQHGDVAMYGTVKRAVIMTVRQGVWYQVLT